MVELNRADEWPAFLSRMRHQFEQLVDSKPTCLDDIVQELRKENESITFLDVMRDRLADVQETDLHELAPQMQRHGYYASVQGPWLVCSKSKKRHDTMLFAAQAAQVLAEANMMLIPLPNPQYTESKSRRLKPIPGQAVRHGRLVHLSFLWPSHQCRVLLFIRSFCISTFLRQAEHSQRSVHAFVRV